MEIFLEAVNEYNNAETEKEAEEAIQLCRNAFAGLVREYAPVQSHGAEE